MPICKTCNEIFNGPKFRTHCSYDHQYKDPDIIKKRSDSVKNAWRDPEHRKNLLNGRKIVWSSSEFVKRMSDSQKAAWDRPDRGGRYRSIESKEKSKNSANERWSKIEEREKLSKSISEWWNSPENRDRLVDAAIKRNQNPNFRKKVSIAMKEKWSDPEYAKRQTEAIGRKPTKLELFVEDNLNLHHPGEWKYVGDGDFWIGYMNPDFININGKKQVLEVLGDYWHNEEEVQERIINYKKYSFDMLYVWEYEIEGNFFKKKFNEMGKEEDDG